LSSSSLVPILEVLKEQSFPKDGLRSYKCRLLNRSSDLVKKLSFFYLNDDQNFKVEIHGERSPLGGVWGQAPFVVLRVLETVQLPQGAFLTCKREDFPKLNSDSEYYLSDLLGSNVKDEFGDPQGEIVGFSFDLDKLNSPVNLRIQNGDREYECPHEWIDEIKLNENLVVIGGVYRWQL